MRSKVSKSQVGESGGELENKRRDLRILWSSNSHWSYSGYGVFTRDLLFRLRDDGWPLAEVAFWGLQGNPTTVDGIKIYPAMSDPYGSDAMFNHSIDFKSNVTFSMQDVWSLQLEALQGLKSRNIPWIPYLPIDQSPIPDSILQRLNFAYKIISFSKFGQSELEKHGYSSQLILEGVDTNIFKPADKIEARKKLNLPEDMFLFAMIAANKENPPRKGFQEALEAFELFHRLHPNSGIYFHTQQISPTGFPIQNFAHYLGIEKNVFFADQYTATYNSDSQKVALEINACDAVLHPSMTEGFGLLVVEGQSCGKPVLIQRCTSMPELVIENKTGWICEADKKWWRNMGGYVYMADVSSLYEKMNEVYDKLSSKNTIAKDARNNVLKNYDIDVIFKNQWIPLFESLQKKLLING